MLLVIELGGMIMEWMHKKEINHLEKNRERMQYDLLCKKKLPIGSGAVESGIRQVVNMRLKGVGMFWLFSISIAIWKKEDGGL